MPEGGYCSGHVWPDSSHLKFHQSHESGKRGGAFDKGINRAAITVFSLGSVPALIAEGVSQHSEWLRRINPGPNILPDNFPLALSMWSRINSPDRRKRGPRASRRFCGSFSRRDWRCLGILAISGTGNDQSM